MTYSDAVHELYVDMSIYGVIFCGSLVLRWLFALTQGYNNRLTKSSQCVILYLTPCLRAP